MAVILRLSRRGVRGKPHYRLVATDSQNKRDGRSLEVVGTYDPMKNPPVVKLNEESIRKWIARGAQTSTRVRDILVKAVPGLVEVREKHKLEKIRAARKARKTRAAKRTRK